MRTFGFLLVAGALVVGASVATASDAQADVVLGFGVSGGCGGCGHAYYPARPVYVPTYSYPAYSYPAYSYPRYRRAYYPTYRRSYYPAYRPYVSTSLYFGGHRHYGRSHRYYGHGRSHFGHGRRSVRSHRGRRGSRRVVGRRR